MHRYEELEKLYYKKLYLKIFFGLLFIVILLFGSFFYITSTHKKVKKNLKKIEKVKLHNKKTKKPKPKLKPKFKEVKNIKKEKKSLKHYELKFMLPDINSIKEPENNITEKNESNIKKVNKKKIIKKVTKIKTKIKIKESNINLNDLIKNYKNNPSYNLAITIAKIFLKKNEIKKAQIWALKANSLNPSKPDSWIIFADILIKQGKIKKAKEILNVYITSYGNNDIIDEKLRSLDGK